MRFKPPPPNSSIGWRVEFRQHSIGVSYQYQLIWPTGIREDLKKKANHKQELHMTAILIVRSAQHMEIYSPLLAY
jgi:hypothetical protein